MSQIFTSRAGEPVLIVDATSGSEYVDLPGGFASGREFTVRRTDSSVNAVTVRVPEGESLNGMQAATISVQRGTELSFQRDDEGDWSSYGGGGGSSSSSGGVTPEDLSAAVAERANLTLSNVDASASRTSLGLGSAALVNTTALTVAQSQVTGLTTSLSRKADIDPATGKLTSSQLPPIPLGETFTVGSQAAMLALAAAKGDIAIRTDEDVTYRLVATPPSVLANWLEIPAQGSVVSVAGKTGTVTLEEGDVSGLTARIDAKADEADVTTALALKADASSVSGKADTASVVALAGTQTITGSKTFSLPITVATGSGPNHAPKIDQTRTVLIWNGSTYGAKPGTLAEYIGPVEPNNGLLTSGSVAAGDLWTEVDLA